MFIVFNRRVVAGLGFFVVNAQSTKPVSTNIDYNIEGFIKSLKYIELG